MQTLDLQIKCVKSEIARRKSLFPLLIESGKMSKEFAMSEISLMQKVFETLTQLKGLASR